MTKARYLSCHCRFQKDTIYFNKSNFKHFCCINGRNINYHKNNFVFIIASQCAIVPAEIYQIDQECTCTCIHPCAHAGKCVHMFHIYLTKDALFMILLWLFMAPLLIRALAFLWTKWMYSTLWHVSGTLTKYISNAFWPLRNNSSLSWNVIVFSRCKYFVIVMFIWSLSFLYCPFASSP